MHPSYSENKNLSPKASAWASAFLGAVLILAGAALVWKLAPSDIFVRHNNASAVSARVNAYNRGVIEDPVRLIIPAIGVDAEIQHVGIGSNGSMEVPTNYKAVGWYSLGFYPGSQGNSVIDGHLDNSLGLEGVFSDLDKLQEGDQVIVVGADGKRLTFSVTGMESYQYTDAPLAKIFGPSDGYHLNLITCDGAWIDEVKSYDRRLIVSTELMGTRKLDGV